MARSTCYERTRDPRVLPFLTRDFAFQSAVPGPQFARIWAGKRFGDNIESIYWTYNRTGEASLLALARTMHDKMAEYGQFAGGGFAGDENFRPGFVARVFAG